jgi:hypothetical protein
MLAVSVAMILVALIGCSTAQTYPAQKVSYTPGVNPAWYVNGYVESNTTFNFEQSVQGNGYFMTYLYAKAGNVAVKNYAHGSGSINNEAILTYYDMDQKRHNVYTDYNDVKANCIQFKETNSMVYAPMKIAVGTGYYAANPVDYSSLLKERTWVKNYRSGTSMLHEVEYAHALDKDLNVLAKESFNITYDPEIIGFSTTKMNVNEDMTDGKAHIGVLQASDNFANLNTIDSEGSIGGQDIPNLKSALKNPAIEIDEDYWGTYHIEKNMTLEVPYHLIQKGDDWLPCCTGGFADMNYEDKKPFKSATGIFDCTCFKAATQAQFPRVYN